MIYNVTAKDEGRDPLAYVVNEINDEHAHEFVLIKYVSFDYSNILSSFFLCWGST